MLIVKNNQLYKQFANRNQFQLFSDNDLKYCALESSFTFFLLLTLPSFNCIVMCEVEVETFPEEKAGGGKIGEHVISHAFSATLKGACLCLNASYLIGVLSLWKFSFPSFVYLYKEFDEDIYLLAFFLHPTIEDTQFELHDDVQQMIKLVFEEEELLIESENDNLDNLSESQPDETNENIEELNIEDTIKLGPWVFIDNSTLPTLTRRYNSDDDNDEWDLEELV
ncbi:hypothetical protein RclHR1_31580001 [Rhizophagus clarus]|uniref:Uncharacterized protein n=1 Tax=Rhizophagus clarus TaxID=94130 RepID=A0A2Z6RM16_9GLOM|nr:hypothetical protein RclHR1_31580001 [Rhizophagus clarus]